MPRRVSLPGADELFRTTGGMALQPSTPAARRRLPGQRRGTSGARAGRGEHAGRDRAGGAAPVDGRADRRRAAPAAGDGGPGAHARLRREPGRHAAVRRARTDPRRTGAAGPVRPGRRRTAAAAAAQAGGAEPPRGGGRGANRRPSGRERHDEKITVYVSAEELMDLEHARLVLRGEHGLAVDRGRIVREAVAVVLADLESRGDASILVRRLRGR